MNKKMFLTVLSCILLLASLGVQMLAFSNEAEALPVGRYLDITWLSCSAAPCGGSNTGSAIQYACKSGGGNWECDPVGAILYDCTHCRYTD